MKTSCYSIRSNRPKMVANVRTERFKSRFSPPAHLIGINSTQIYKIICTLLWLLIFSIFIDPIDHCRCRLLCYILRKQYNTNSLLYWNFPFHTLRLSQLALFSYLNFKLSNLTIVSDLNNIIFKYINVLFIVRFLNLNYVKESFASNIFPSIRNNSVKMVYHPNAICVFAEILFLNHECKEFKDQLVSLEPNLQKVSLHTATANLKRNLKAKLSKLSLLCLKLKKIMVTYIIDKGLGTNWDQFQVAIHSKCNFIDIDKFNINKYIMQRLIYLYNIMGILNFL